MAAGFQPAFARLGAGLPTRFVQDRPARIRDFVVSANTLQMVGVCGQYRLGGAFEGRVVQHRDGTLEGFCRNGSGLTLHEPFFLIDGQRLPVSANEREWRITRDSALQPPPQRPEGAMWYGQRRSFRELRQQLEHTLAYERPYTEPALRQGAYFAGWVSGPLPRALRFDRAFAEEYQAALVIVRLPMDRASVSRRLDIRPAGAAPDSPPGMPPMMAPGMPGFYGGGPVLAGQAQALEPGAESELVLAGEVPEGAGEARVELAVQWRGPAAGPGLTVATGPDSREELALQASGGAARVPTFGIASIPGAHHLATATFECDAAMLASQRLRLIVANESREPLYVHVDAHAQIALPDRK
jgi:hypothetical protein